MSFTSVIQQNNNGVACLNARDFHNAVTSFSTAARLLKALEAMDCRSLSSDSDDDQAEECVDECMLLRDIDEVKACTPPTFVYDHAIMILPTVQDRSIATAIVIFNLALSYQLMAGRNSDDLSSKWRLNARRMYELAYQTQQDSTGNELFQFAIGNNIAVIDREIANESDSNECFDYVLSVMMMFADQGLTAQLRHVQGFFVNIPYTLETAAAAA